MESVCVLGIDFYLELVLDSEVDSNLIWASTLATRIG